MVSDCGPLLVIEFLASIEPASLPLLAVLAFAVSLYPLGLMLGSSCSPCCDIPCGECETGKLPDTVTVTFDGYPDFGAPFDALTVSFESCHGEGATATAAAPAAPAAGGPITGITVTDGGSGYAKLARVEPTVTADGPGGTGADITVTLSEEVDECGIPYWTVSDLTVVDGGEGYTDGGEVVFTVASGDTEELPAGAIVQTSRDEPELTIVPPEDSGTGATFTVTLDFAGNNPDTWYISGITVTDGGTGYTNGQIATVGLGEGDVEQASAYLVLRTGRAEPELTLTGEATLTVNVASLGGTPETWEIDSITVVDGGSGYSDGQYLNIILGPDDVQLSFPSLRIKTVRAEPTVYAQAQFTSGGSGAVLTVNLVESGDVWTVDSITVVDGGSGYAQDELFSLLPSIGQTVSFGTATANVDGGVITSLTITDGGEYFLDTGVIDEVVVEWPGLFYKDTGIIESVDIFYGGIYYKSLGDIADIFLTVGGVYYREDPDGEPYVAEVTVTLNQIAPSDGAGATFTVAVDDDPDSPTFGQITGVTVDDGGDGYLSQGLPSKYCTGEYMNGREFVLVRRKFLPDYLPGSPGEFACRYTAFMCDPLTSGFSGGGLSNGAYSGNVIEFEFNKSSPLLGAPHVGFSTEETLSDCDSFEIHFESNGLGRPAFHNVTATVVSGGGSVESAIDPNLYTMFTTVNSSVGVCGSCCLNEEPTPVEVTVSIANLVQDPIAGRLPDGDYVFIRDPFFEQSFPNFGNDNATIWRVPGESFFVVIEPCATLDFDSGSENQTDLAWFPGECGDTCYKKCRLRLVFNSLAVSAEYTPGCDCIDFPVCSPPPGNYTMESFGTPYYTATIS